MRMNLYKWVCHSVCHSYENARSNKKNYRCDFGLVWFGGPAVVLQCSFYKLQYPTSYINFFKLKN